MRTAIATACQVHGLPEFRVQGSEHCICPQATDSEVSAINAAHARKELLGTLGEEVAEILNLILGEKTFSVDLSLQVHPEEYIRLFIKWKDLLRARTLLTKLEKVK